MPLSNFLQGIMSASSSRKRPHDEISRSESPADSNASRAKRRRLRAVTPTSTRYQLSGSRPPHLTSTESTHPMPRFVGDGIDTRRPMMSTRTTGPEPDTIDLTADDDVGPDAEPEFDIPFSRDDTQETIPELSEPDRNVRRRAPPFLRESMAGHEVIDLEDDSNEEAATQVRRGRASIPAPHILHREESSPDLVITGSRPVPEELRELDPQRRLPTPPILRFRFGGQGGITDYLRRGREIIFGTGGGANGNLDQPDVQDVQHIYPPLPPLGSFDNLIEPAAPELPLPDLPGEYGNVAFNYQRAAFPIARARIGGRNAIRSSTPPEVIDPEPYKEPQAVLPGYSRNLAEDDIAICPACEEELASGGNDLKQQVWVSKTCGHVYCGDCVISPQSKANPATASTTKDKKRSKQQKVSTQLKTCVVDGCGAKLNGKGALFQMYL